MITRVNQRGHYRRILSPHHSRYNSGKANTFRDHPLMPPALGRDMIRLVIVLALLGTAPLPLHAQSAPADGDDSHFSYNRVDDGYLRLDTHTGMVSLCNRQPVGWSCAVVPDDRSILDHEISRLHAENAALKKALLDRGLTLPAGVAADHAATAGQQATAGDENVSRVKAWVGRVWRHLVVLIMNFQRDVMKKT
jgi:hypothetical protein